MRPTALNLFLLIIGLVVGIAAPILAGFLSYLTRMPENQVDNLIKQAWMCIALILAGFTSTIAMMVLPQSDLGLLGIVPLVAVIGGVIACAVNFEEPIKAMSKYDSTENADVVPMRRSMVG